MSIRYDEANRIFELDTRNTSTGSESSMKRGLSDIYIMDRRFVRRNVISF